MMPENPEGSEDQVCRGLYAAGMQTEYLILGFLRFMREK